MIEFIVTLPHLIGDETMDDVRDDLESTIQEEYCADAVVKEHNPDAYHADSRP